MRINKDNLDLSLYLVLDPSFISLQSCEQVLHEAIQAGVNIIQLREKKCSNEEFLMLAKKMSNYLKNTNVPLIINDRLDIAQKVQADGVHLGQSDISWQDARRVLGDQALIGLSVETPEQAEKSMLIEVDYLGVSSVFPTESKKEIKTFWGLDGLRELSQTSSKPLVAIGGINATNTESVVEAGAHGIAVVSSICSAENPFQEAVKLKTLIQKVRNQKS